VLADPLDGVARVYEAFFDDREVDPRAPAGEEPLHDIRAAETDSEFVARDARLGDLHHSLTDSKMVADARVLFAQPFGRQILAEHGPRQFHVREFAAPEFVMLGWVGVNGLVAPTVVFEIGLMIAIEVEPAQNERARH